MRINISFYTLVLIILVSILTVKHAVEIENPCSSQSDSTVADMCTDDFKIEEAAEGSTRADSILLRIKKYQNNCTCHVSLEIGATNYTIFMSKYEGESNAAPVEPNCGLAVDVDYVSTSETSRPLQPIECISGTSTRPIMLEGNELKFTSRIINGNFTRGYCIRLYRHQQILFCKMNNPEQETAGIDDDWFKSLVLQNFDDCKSYCLQNEACVAVSYENDNCFVYNQTTATIKKDNTVYSQKHCVDSQKLKIRCHMPESVASTSKGTTLMFSSSTKMETVTTPINDTMTNSNTQSTMKEEKKFNEDKNYDMYVYLGAAAGGVLMILLIVCIIVCIRKQSHKTSLNESKNDSKKEFCKEDRDSDNDSCGLKDNILYVSSGPNEILEDGNYNTVDLEKTRKVNQDINLDGNYSTVDGLCSNSSITKSKPVIKPKPKTNASFKKGPDEETIHLSTMDNSNNEYAVVDKGRNSDAAKNINPEHGNDTEYAVVNKVKRSSTNN